MSTTQTLLQNVEQGVPSGNYDGSSLDFASDAAAGPGYYQGNAGTQTVAVRVANFDGVVQLQGTLDCLPGDTTNWVSLAEFDTSDSAASYTELVTVTGQFVWIRARVLNFLDGTIESVTSTYAGAGADIGGTSDATAGIFSSVTANAVYVGAIGVTSTGNVTAPYFVGNGSLLTGVANLGSFSVETQTASGNGALIYNSSNGVFQFTPADAGASNYGNANVSAYAESGWAGNIVPGQDSVYSLGNSARQWSELWVANTTIYIGGVPVGVVGNTLTVAGEAVLSNDSNTAITTTGNITAQYFIGNGSQLTGLPAQYGNANVADYLPTYSGNISDIAITDQNIEAYGLGANSVGLRFRPNEPKIAFSVGLSNVFNITNIGASTSGNISAGNILTDNYLYANGAPFVSASTGNITFTDTTMSPPDGTDMILSAANSEVRIEAFDVRLDATDDLRLTGNDIVSLRNRSTTDSITIRTDYDNNDYVWEFAVNGTLTTPGDIVTAGDVTGTAGASTLYFKTQPDSNTYIQLNNSVDSVISTVANLEIRTDVSNTAQVWQFDTTGLLTAPGNITATNFLGNIAAANVIGTVSAATTAGTVTTAAQPNITSVGTLTALSVSGNVSADYFVGNGSALFGLTYNQTGNIVGDQANVTLVAGSYSWTFDNTGNAAFANGTVSANNVSLSGDLAVTGNVNSNSIVTKVSALIDQDESLELDDLGLQIIDESGCKIQIRSVTGNVSAQKYNSQYYSQSALSQSKGGVIDLTTAYQTLWSSVNERGSQVDLLIRFDSGSVYRAQILTGSSSSPYNDNFVIIEKLL